jgi:exonuclease SbcC
VATEQERRAQAHEAKGSIEYRLLEATPLRQRLGECIRELEGIRGSTDAVIRMADFATATRSEVLHRVKLSSFVLMRRFQSVVDAANDRLDAISEGRYQLVVETRGLDNRGLAGLDLLVADQQTEQSRSTKSLSGGERFYVALALALGLADVVRSESGGVELGTLFIDEGFGSLDADTLEEVLDMLEHVRAGEDRVIGLVSHVDLLKQRIDARISVRRDPQRSAVSTLQVSV